MILTKRNEILNIFCVFLARNIKFLMFNVLYKMLILFKEFNIDI